MFDRLDPRNWHVPELMPYPPSYRKKYIDREGGPVIPVSALNIAERCYLNCPYCSFDIKPNGLLMPWDLFQAVVHSDQVHLYKKTPIHLGDGEPLIYEDRAHGKNLIDILKVLVCELGVSVTLSTAGLMPPNRRLGLEVLRRLPELGEAARSHIEFFVSFTHLREGISVEENDRAMLETLQLLQGWQVAMLPLLPQGTKWRPSDSYDLSAVVRVSMRDARSMVKLGRARANYQELKVTATVRDSPCQALTFPEPTFLVRANGNITIDCGCSGYCGTSTGNVYDNDADQIFALHREFLAAHAKRCRWSSKAVDRCDAHRTWNQQFIAKQSTNPIIQRRQPAVR